MSAISNCLNAHNFLIFQPILMTLVSNFMGYRAPSDKKILIIRVAVPFKNLLSRNHRADFDENFV